MDLKDKIEKLAFNFENEDGMFKNSAIFLTDLLVIPEIKQLLIQPVSNSYAVVRWYENNHEDVVCVDKQVALNYEDYRVESKK
jgi:hypothetical protein